MNTPLDTGGIDWNVLEPETGILLFSQPSVADPYRYITKLQIDRRLWDSAGFTTNARESLYADFDGDVLKIARDGTRRVKRREATSKGVVVEIPNLGYLNVGSVKVGVGNGSLLLRGEALI
ncbi:hypothetical protein ACFONL_01110 [Camelimonas fluminis]|uniref:Uncharacterized protein n=1 Tax=Camelimonas fluminis TaxID=1576911 RepID=A0ABV7UBY4_9HYPH